MAARAGYKCSYPSCLGSTIGPGILPEEFILTGHACHIFSASPNGPRGRGGLSDEELRSASNCIWLCSNHAKVVDTHRGQQFPPSLLLSYKSLREARASREQDVTDGAFWWFHELSVIRSPVFRPDAQLRLGHATLISGNNESGKTAICEFLSGASDTTALDRWSRGQMEDSGPSVIIQLAYFNPAEQAVRIECGPEGTLRFSLNGVELPFLPHAVRSVYLRHYLLPRPSHDADELMLISKILRLDSVHVENIIPRIWTVGVNVEKLWLDRSGNSCILRSRLRGESLDLPFLGRSHSQQASILIELAAAMAHFSSQYTPTLLVLDGGVHTLDQSNLSRYATAFSSSRNRFQTVMVLPNPPKDLSALHWAGWQVARLEGIRPVVTIVQDE